MKIQKAIEKANAQKRGITRESWFPAPVWLIPTNTPVGMVIVSKNKEFIPGWSPQAADINATDWIVYG